MQIIPLDGASQHLSRLLRNVSSLAASRLNDFADDQDGVTSIEYVLVASCLVLAIAGICGSMFGKLSNEYGEIASAFS